MLRRYSCGLLGSGSVPEPADRDPVLLISGIGGTILHSKNKRFGCETRIWVRLLLAEMEFKNKAWSVYNPETGYTEVLDDSTEIVVPQDDYGLYAIDILDPSAFVKCLHISDCYHFHEMIEMLVGCGYEKGTTLFGYGYDFRQSNRIDQLMDGLKERLKTAYKASGGRKVNIISHSMGGLLVSCFISLHGDIFSEYVNKWIGIATPFQGAPGCINDTLLTGLQFVEGFKSFFFVSRWTMHQLLVECPSIYEMLPNPDFKWKKEPVVQVWRKHSTEDGETSAELETYGCTQCVTLFEEALANNELNYDGKSVALPFNTAIYKWASGTRKILDSVKLPDGISFYNIYGTSFDTPFDVCYGSESSPIEKSSEICHSMPQYSNVDGDGTVPSESAKADHFEAVERVGIMADHRGLLDDENVHKLIQKWLGVSPKDTSKKKRIGKVVDA
ncbi:phospholipase A(1) LCAT3-like [Andrographis paniculata]|uniref:phospholipase A(1) LCAT3-like n=1 Tax=Andrographis paniculata TaxID=175694 RepID=UPI0021E7940C|nr:phospholipase A(1) LCAT3-like [Andrographis paniculata]